MKSFIYSVLLHAAVAALLFLSIEFTPKPLAQHVQSAPIVSATTIDEKQVEQELKRIQETERAEQKKQEDAQRKLVEAEKKAKQVEQQRKTEEKRLAELAKKKEAEQKEREQEQKKLAEVKKEQEELEQKRKAEEEKQKKEEEAKKRKEAEEALKKQLAEEQKRTDAARAKQDQGIINQYAARIKAAIEQEFNTTGLPPGLSCVLKISMIPGGEVASVQVAKSSGNAIFDSRAQIAVEKASPLPVPEEARLFEKFRSINFTFTPEY